MRLISLIIGFVIIIGMSVNGQEISTNYGDQLDEAMELILDKYLDNLELTKEELFEAAMMGMFGRLDVYSTYIAAKDTEAFNNRLDNRYVGIGIAMVQEGEYIVIDRVFSESPANEVGLKIHDKIIGAEGVNLIGKTPAEAANIIIGEKDTKVNITIDRQGYIFSVEIIRGDITINVVERLDLKDIGIDVSEKVLDSVGYLKIESFTGDVSEELKELLSNYQEEGKEYLLLDLRDNGGGYVNAGVAVCNQLVPEGNVLKFINNKSEETIYTSKLKNENFKIVALINENSASATEFVSAAIQESGIGILVGETTYGKGVAQRLYKFNDGSIIKLTEEAFYSGEGVKINGVGVTPDIEVIVPDYLSVEVKYHLGDIYDSVKNVEEILTFLGYNPGEIDNYYSQQTKEAIKNFQRDQSLYVYGVCDFTTQKKLNQAIIDSQKYNDVQLLEGLNQIIELME